MSTLKDIRDGIYRQRKDHVERHLFLYGSTILKEGGTYADRNGESTEAPQRCKGGAATGVTR